jgi:hypothetical protein
MGHTYYFFPKVTALEVQWFQHFNNILKDKSFFNLFILPSSVGSLFFPSFVCPHGCKLAAAAPSFISHPLMFKKGGQNASLSLSLFQSKVCLSRSHYVEFSFCLIDKNYIIKPFLSQLNEKF